MAKKAKKQAGGAPVRLGTPSRRAAAAAQPTMPPSGGGGPAGGPRFALDAPPRRPFGITGGRGMDRRAQEKATADLQRLIEQAGAGSREDVNALLQRHVGPGSLAIPDAPPRNPLEEAQLTMYHAFAEKGEKRAELAREALSISPDCADAYVLLAEETTSTAEEALALYQQGVEAGKRALGTDAFEEDKGRFWGVLETRPYMRARQGLARCLCLLGRTDEAIEHFQEMLRLNTTDNQGNRHFLVNLLLEQGRDEDVRKLLAQFPGEPTPWWHYSRALLGFRDEGPKRAAKRGLAQATEANPHVPDYLLGRKPIPPENPSLMTVGSDDEAVVYAADALPVWQKSEGALEWLESELTS